MNFQQNLGKSSHYYIYFLMFNLSMFGPFRCSIFQNQSTYIYNPKIETEKALERDRERERERERDREGERERERERERYLNSVSDCII
jgi:hypothetical protein